MKHIFLFAAAFILSINVFSQNSLSGKITNEKGDPILGAIVYIPDLKVGVSTHGDGSYVLEQLPRGNFLVEVRNLGFVQETEQITVAGAVTKDFKLTESYTETREVVITGISKATEINMTPAPITEVDHDYLTLSNAPNIIEALNKIPGVSAVTDGPAIAKPVIRGLGYNRVVTVNDGVRQEGQQWGDEFGIEVDPNSVDRVEILKGPASLVYGSDAISGVVNLISEPNLPEGMIKGNINYNYQTNNGLHNVTAQIGGNNHGITWSARYTAILAHAYQNKYDGYVFNSQFSNRCYEGSLGYHGKWGFSQVSVSFFDMRTGIVEGARDPVTGQFQKHNFLANGTDSATNVTYQDLTSYTPYLINQIVQHAKVVWDNSFAVGKGNIIARFSWQQNSRREHNDPSIPDVANIWYFRNTITYDVRYNSPTWHGFDFTAGANGQYAWSKNRGTLLLIPEYTQFDIGAFVIANYKYKNLNLSGGVRYDTRMFKAKDDYVDINGNQVSPGDSTAIHQFTAYTSNFSGVSGSIGATYQLPKGFFLKANLSHGYRAPNVAESGSNGVHDGTVVYEYGTSTLKPETSTQVDFALGINTKDVSAELDVFGNFINNFIYPKQLKSTLGGDSIVNNVPGYPSAPAFRYTQGNATLWGGEVALDIHPSAIKWFDFYAGYSIVNASLNHESDTTKYLPFIPPAKLRLELTLKMKKLGNALSKPFIRLGMNYTFKQTHVYYQTQIYSGLPSGTPESQASLNPSSPYGLFNAAIGTDFMMQGNKICTVVISCDNIFDVAYMDYMSRFKYYPVNGATNRVGVFNMGRNFSFKVLVPLVFKK